MGRWTGCGAGSRVRGNELTTVVELNVGSIRDGNEGGAFSTDGRLGDAGLRGVYKQISEACIRVLFPCSWENFEMFSAAGWSFLRHSIASRVYSYHQFYTFWAR